MMPETLASEMAWFSAIVNTDRASGRQTQAKYGGKMLQLKCYRQILALAIALSFFSLICLGALSATQESPVAFEKEAPPASRELHKHRFPLLPVLGGIVAAGALLYLLLHKKSGEPSLVIEPAGTVSDYDGNVYAAVRIGDQVWMAENLRSTHYSDGAPIECWPYNDDPAMARTYGRLYRLAALTRGAASSVANPSGVQGAAPQGWHIPSPAEWQQLAATLGGASVAGGKLKESGTAHWLSPNTGATNESLFAGLPAGFRGVTGNFQWLGTQDRVRHLAMGLAPPVHVFSCA